MHSLNLVPCEADHFHGITHGFEISAIIDARLQRQRRDAGGGSKLITGRTQETSSTSKCCSEASMLVYSVFV